MVIKTLNCNFFQIVLVEPDSTRLGWGVATFVGFLQDLEVVTDKDDSRLEVIWILCNTIRRQV